MAGSAGNILVECTETKIKVLKIFEGDYGQTLAQLGQATKEIAHLPSKQVSNEFQGNIFTPADCGYTTEKRESIRKRNCLLVVPPNTTVEQLQTNLDTNFPNARIYRILADNPVLTAGDKEMIKQGKIKLEDKIAKQRAVNPDTGEILHTFDGKEFYRALFFDPTGTKEDLGSRDNLYHVEPFGTAKPIEKAIPMEIDAFDFPDEEN